MEKKLEKIEETWENLRGKLFWICSYRMLKINRKSFCIHKLKFNLFYFLDHTRHVTHHLPPGHIWFLISFFSHRWLWNCILKKLFRDKNRKFSPPFATAQCWVNSLGVEIIITSRIIELLFSAHSQPPSQINSIMLLLQ